MNIPSQLPQTAISLLKFLQAHNVSFELYDHEAAQTCERAARLRGTPLNWGGKTMLLRAKTEFFLATMPAHLRANNNLLRKVVRTDKLRFARTDELRDLLGYPPGAIPPIGRPLHDLALVIDRHILEQEKVAFNIGVLTHSVVVKRDEFLASVNHRICSFVV